jgi:hypothetical protein
MNQFFPEEACSWTDIKRRLDPAWSYLVVESTGATSSADVFDSITALLTEHAEGIRSQEVCREAASGKLLLLVQIDPRQTEAVKSTLLDPRLPPSFTVYFYNHSPLESEQRRRPGRAQ